MAFRAIGLDKDTAALRGRRQRFRTGDGHKETDEHQSRYATRFEILGKPHDLLPISRKTLAWSRFRVAMT
jgi:hypothetical protein